MKIKCSTLFDITKNKSSTRRGLLQDIEFTENQYNQQRNFETILQIIGLRSQPEDITDPVIFNDKKVKWGSIHNKLKKIKYWQFSFTVEKNYVFSDGENTLGTLLDDCGNVPMIVGLTEIKSLVNTLMTDGENRNITFEIIDD